MPECSHTILSLSVISYGLAMGWLWADYRLAIDWLLAISWLAMWWLLTGNRIAPNQYSSRHSHILLCTNWNMAAINTLDCIVFTFISLSAADYWLTIPWLANISPEINTLQDICTYHYVPTWNMDAINTLSCSVFTRIFGYRLAISWLLAGYVKKSMHFKT